MSWILSEDAIKSLSLASSDGWETILGQATSKGAWGAAYWNAVVLKRANMTRAIPRVIQRGDDEVTEKDTGIRFQGGLGGLMFRGSMSLDRTGAFYAAIIPNRAGGVHSVRFVNPATIVVDYDLASGTLKGFRRDYGAERGAYFKYDEETDTAETYDGVQLLWSWTLGLAEVGPGYSLEDMVKLPAGLLNASDAAMSALMRRGAIAQHIIKAPHEPPEEQRERLLSKLRRALWGGVDGSNDVSVIPSFVEIQKIGTDPKDLEMTAIDSGNMTDVSAVADTPRMLLDPSIGANRALLDRVSSNYILNTIVPHAQQLVDSLNWHVFEPQELMLTINPESMSSNQEDERSRATAFNYYYQTGIPKETIAAILGIDVPEGMDLGPDASAETIAQELEPPTSSPIIEGVGDAPEDDDAKALELDKLRRFMGKGTHLERDFHSDVLTPDEIKAAMEGAVSQDNFFILKGIPKDHPQRTQFIRWEREFGEALTRAIRKWRAAIFRGLNKDNVQQLPGRITDPKIRNILQDAIAVELQRIAAAGVDNARGTFEAEVLGVG